MAKSIRPFLMFRRDAEQAMRFYASLFADAEILDVSRYGPGQAGAEGSVLRAAFRLGDQTVMCIDSPVEHAFGFTPSFSFFVECDGEAEMDRLCAALGEGGEFLMPPDDYGFSRRFAWLNDRFGVSWQLNLA